MNITYIYYPQYGSDAAHSKQILHTCNALSERDHSVTVIAFGDLHSCAKDNNINIRFEVVEVPILTTHKVVSRAYYYTVSLFYSITSDLIYTRDIYFLMFLSKLPFQIRIPIVYEAHKVYSQLSILSENQETKVIDQASKTVAISGGVSKDLELLGIKVDAIIPDAANIDLVPEKSKEDLRHQLDLPQEDTVFVYAGSFKLWKNDLNLVLEGFSHLQIDSKHLILIGGTTNDIQQLSTKSSDLGIHPNNITFTGTIPHTKVFNYLKAADVGVVPLKKTNAQSSRYTSPLKLYEYLVSELIVVASDVQALSEVNDSRMFQYATGDLESFIDTCTGALNYTYNYIKNEEYSYDHRAESIENFLQK